ncbi:MAG: ribonuclease H-like domain-containing protein [Acidobacteria bacterium]|nr:ribonuclease H-like domain-containing protein [Acidobacteriota bacterium]
MKRLVIDIETVGIPWEEHDTYVREYLIKGMGEAEAEEEKRRGALSPFTGRIAVIGVLNVDDGRRAALIEMPGRREIQMWKEDDRTYITGTEKQILEKFWEFFAPVDRFITFNGRQFDGPFLMIRSAVNGVIPRRDLIGRRYSYHPNCDLREALNFMGTVYSRQMRFNLDLACKTFGVDSSKTEGMDGRSVETMYRSGMHREIADYCLEDVRATGELYLKLAPTILCWNDDFSRAEKIAEARTARASRTQSELPDESEFMRGVEESSAQLSSSIDEPQADTTPKPDDADRRQQAHAFEKLVRENDSEEDDLESVETP